MKFKIDYDIMKKIKQANEGITPWECYIEAVKFSPLTLFPPASTVLSLIDAGKNNIFNNSMQVCLINAILFFLQYGICTYDVKRRKTEIMNDASCDLNKLVNDLYSLEVRTSNELFLKSEVIQTEYEPIYKDNRKKIPSKLKQKKYIKIPLTTGYEETILQEHVFGDKDYEISVQSPTKKHSFNRRLAKVGI